MHKQPCLFYSEGFKSLKQSKNPATLTDDHYTKASSGRMRWSDLEGKNMQCLACYIIHSKSYHAQVGILFLYSIFIILF